MMNLCTGSKISVDGKFEDLSLVAKNDKDSLPLEFNIKRSGTVECTFSELGHNGIYHRRQIVSVNHVPSLKVKGHNKFTRV